MNQLLKLLQHTRLLRRPLGLLFFGLAVLGFILPIMPTWPFAIPAIVLLGRRDPLIRHTHLLLRRMLRRLRRARQSWIRALGMRGSAEYLRAKRMLTPVILEAERQFGTK